MTEDQKTPETEEPTPATEGEQDVEGHKIRRPGGLQPGSTAAPVTRAPGRVQSRQVVTRSTATPRGRRHRRPRSMSGRPRPQRRAGRSASAGSGSRPAAHVADIGISAPRKWVRPYRPHARLASSTGAPIASLAAPAARPLQAQTPTPSAAASAEPAGSARRPAAPSVTPSAITPSPSAAALPQGSEPVTLDPAQFAAIIDHPFWPMIPGSRWTYREQDLEGSTQDVEVTVTTREEGRGDSRGRGGGRRHW